MSAPRNDVTLGRGNLLIAEQGLTATHKRFCLFNSKFMSAPYNDVSLINSNN